MTMLTAALTPQAPLPVVPANVDPHVIDNT